MTMFDPGSYTPGKLFLTLLAFAALAGAIVLMFPANSNENSSAPNGENMKASGMAPGDNIGGITQSPAPTQTPIPSGLTRKPSLVAKDVAPRTMCWSAMDTSRMKDACKMLKPPELPANLPAPSCRARDHKAANRVGTCMFQDCPTHTGASYCNTSGIRECFCRQGTCKSTFSPFSMCLSNTARVKYGVARNTLEWQCPYYYCQVWNHGTSSWEPTTSADTCSKICLPHLYPGYDTLPPNVTTEEQLRRLG